jgi:hypothetical protein
VKNSVQKRLIRILRSRNLSKNIGLQENEHTIATGEFHDFYNKEAQINDCDNIDNGENIDSEATLILRNSIFKIKNYIRRKIGNGF